MKKKEFASLKNKIDLLANERKLNSKKIENELENIWENIILEASK